LLKSIYKVLAFLLVGFTGGAITPWVMGWMKSVAVSTPSDAYAIANTYIVFTTIIFVGITVVLAITGYVFTQQFSATKESQLHHLVDELKQKIMSGREIGEKLADATLKNPNFHDHIDKQINRKLDELIQQRLAETQAAANSANQDDKTMAEIASQLSPMENSHE